MPSPIPDQLTAEVAEARVRYAERRARRKAKKVGYLRPITEAQDFAHRLIEAAGFERTYVARKLESYNYRLPPHRWLLRLFLHKRQWRSNHPDARLVISSVAFGNGEEPNEICLCQRNVNNRGEERGYFFRPGRRAV